MRLYNIKQRGSCLLTHQTLSKKGKENIKYSSHFPLLGADVQNIVSSEKRISVLVLQLTVDILFSLLYGDVHVTIQTG